MDAKIHTLDEISSMSLSEKRKIMELEAGLFSDKRTKKATKKRKKESKTQGKKGKKGRAKGNKAHALTLQSRPRALTLKFYVEQLMPLDERVHFCELIARDNRINALKNDQMKSYFESVENKLENGFITHDEASELLIAKVHYWQTLSPDTQAIVDKYKKLLVKHIKTINNQWNVAAIWHDKDPVSSDDDVFLTSIKKPHCHLLIFLENGKKFRLSQVLDLLGINFDPVVDKTLMDCGGIASCVDKSAFFMYLTHETDQAIFDGKFIYDRKEIINNMSDELQDSLRAGYKRAVPKSKLKPSDWDKLYEEAYQIGKSIIKTRIDYDDWERAHLNTVQSVQGPARKLKEAYYKGVSDTITEKVKLVRLSVIIYGCANQGKSYSAKKALINMGKKIHIATIGSGKYDDLRPDTDAILFDDVAVSDARNVFDNGPKVLRRRHSNDRPWLGDYAIVTTNLDWQHEIIAMMGKRYAYERDDLTSEDKTVFDAIASRLYICYINEANGELEIEHKQTRGGDESKKEHNKKMEEFKKAFDNVSMPYYQKLKDERKD